MRGGEVQLVSPVEPVSREWTSSIANSSRGQIGGNQMITARLHLEWMAGDVPSRRASVSDKVVEGLSAHTGGLKSLASEKNNNPKRVYMHTVCIALVL